MKNYKKKKKNLNNFFFKKCSIDGDYQIILIIMNLHFNLESMVKKLSRRSLFLDLTVRIHAHIHPKENNKHK